MTVHYHANDHNYATVTGILRCVERALCKDPCKDL